MDSPNRTQEEYRMALDRCEEKEITKLIGDNYEFGLRKCSSWSNAKDYDISGSRRSILENIIEALTDPYIFMIGVWGKDDNNVTSLMHRVIRRGWRDNLFGMIVMVSIGENPILRRIQDEIAHEIGFSFQGQEREDRRTGCRGFNFIQFNSKKAVIENAQQLSDKIRTTLKILIILRDLRSRLDLEKLGIPFA
ncbi:hypothetical protein RIF29_29492 [Crotalaria pallida]|uniref:Uncharacterized protein n=1 Tax=Crotalaria pallida TaxID=3830 RepID=A0AAN9HWB3_CROPI